MAAAHEAVARRASTAASCLRPVRSSHKSPTARPIAAKHAALGLADLERGRQDRIRATVISTARARSSDKPADRQDRAQSVMGSHGRVLPLGVRTWFVRRPRLGVAYPG